MEGISLEHADADADGRHQEPHSWGMMKREATVSGEHENRLLEPGPNARGATVTSPLGHHARRLGRPPKFRGEFVAEASKLCALGATDQELADFFNVTTRTLYRWKAEHEEFCQAIKAAKDAADDRVERSLYQRAVGYERERVKVFLPGGVSKPVYARYREHVPADVTAAIFWLKNRRRQAWNDRFINEVTSRDGGAIQGQKTLSEIESARAFAFWLREAVEQPGDKQLIEAEPDGGAVQD